MNKEEFVEAINIRVYQSTIAGLRTNLGKPPGRFPGKESIELSSWYNNLSGDDQEMVMKIVKETSRTATFGFLCILDGVRTIESGRSKGELKLYYKRGNKKVLINDQKGDFLHDMFIDPLFNDHKLDDV